MVKTVFFDFNGTILDDMELCLHILNGMLTKRGYDSVSYDKYKEIFGFPIVDYYIKAGFDFNKHPFNILANEFISAYQDASLNCKLCPNVLLMLDYFKSKKYHLVLLSASEINNLLTQTNHFGITNYFDDILGLDNIHATSKVSIALKYFEDKKINKDEAIMIGDTDHDYEVGCKLGIKTYLVSNGHQSYERLLKVTNDVFEDITKLKEIY